MTPDWFELAACKGMDPELFFPARGEDAAFAKAVCAECKVRSECWEYSIETAAKHGVWGGMAERERRRRRVREGISLLGKRPNNATRAVS